MKGIAILGAFFFFNQLLLGQKNASRPSLLD